MSRSNYEYNGIKGLRNIAAHVGMATSTLIDRVSRKKMPIEDAVTQKVESYPPHQYEGVIGLEAIAKKAGLTVGMLRYRLNQLNMTMEDALKVERRPYQRYSYKGLQGLPAISKHYGIKVTTIKTRLYNGWSIEDAVETPVDTRVERKPRKERPTEAIKSPTKLSNNWKLALGIGATL